MRPEEVPGGDVPSLWNKLLPVPAHIRLASTIAARNCRPAALSNLPIET